MQHAVKPKSKRDTYYASLTHPLEKIPAGRCTQEVVKQFANKISFVNLFIPPAPLPSSEVNLSDFSDGTHNVKMVDNLYWTKKMSRGMVN